MMLRQLAVKDMSVCSIVCISFIVSYSCYPSFLCIMLSLHLSTGCLTFVLYLVCALCCLTEQLSPSNTCCHYKIRSSICLSSPKSLTDPDTWSFISPSHLSSHLILHLSLLSRILSHLFSLAASVASFSTLVSPCVFVCLSVSLWFCFRTFVSVYLTLGECLSCHPQSALSKSNFCCPQDSECVNALH